MTETGALRRVMEVFDGAAAAQERPRSPCNGFFASVRMREFGFTSTVKTDHHNAKKTIAGIR